MAERINDHRARPQSVEVADAIFATLAKAEIEIARIDAEAEAQIAKVKKELLDQVKVQSSKGA